MKCYSHSEADARGICKACGRGICRDCIAEVDDSLACKNRCEDRVKSITQVLSRKSLAFSANARTFVPKLLYIISIAFFLPTVFLGFQWYTSNVGLFEKVAGCIFLGLGITVWRIGAGLSSVNQDKSDG